MILVLQWHLHRRVVILLNKKKSIVKEIILRTSPLDFFSVVPRNILSSCEGLVVLFGMRKFSSTRQVTLIANLYSLMYKKKLYSLTTQEDSSAEDIIAQLKRKFPKAESILTPQYTGLPNITQKK